MNDPETKPLTSYCDPEKPLDLKGYEAVGGYGSVKKALRELDPAGVVDMVKDANLRGRGGAGFNAGLKWSFVPKGDNAPKQKYLVCNADEMEPGTFKDRLLMEGKPHQLVEGMIVAAFAIEASAGYLFLRGEYFTAEARLKQAIDEAYKAGYLGKNILGSGFDFDLFLHTSAGRYICGEETALLNALEGKRATPRAKPPFPPAVGLWGKPTIVNNVETLCNVPHIINFGVEWFQGVSNSNDGGTKLYGASGRVNKPGIWELPLGVTMREILEEHAGGMRDGYQFRGALPGGASTDFLTSEHLDLKMDYDSVGKAGSRLGTGTMIILDDKTDLLGMVHNLIKFFAHESCGWCTPCRDGLPWAERIMADLKSGNGVPGDIKTLEKHNRFLWLGYTFCALAPGAIEPLKSAMKHWPEEFEKGVRQSVEPDNHSIRERTRLGLLEALGKQ